MATRALRFLSAITYCVENLETAESAWREYLGYTTIDTGKVDTAHCAAWDTPGAVGQAYCLMQPASGEPVYIRFVESGEAYPFGPPGHFGWCASEFLVKNPDALAQRLADSPFRRLAGPADLFPRPKAPRAMQIVGPCGEVVYFTRILPGGSRYGLKGAKADVDRAFIVPVGGPSMAEMRRFYGGVLGLRTMEPMAFVNPIMAHVCAVDSYTVFSTAIAPIPGRRFLIEMDELPSGVTPRPRRSGMLPPGMSMVSFRTENLDAIDVEFRAPPISLDRPPYDGNRVAVITGPAGEWLELIEGLAS